MPAPPTSHSSAPPPRTLARLCADDAGDEGVIFFSVEGAPPEVCRTEAGADGSLTFRTSVQGRVVEIGPDELVIARDPHRIRVRHLLPRSIDLGDLQGHAVRVDVTQRYEGRGRATIDAVIRDARGRLILWARDGKIPGDRDSLGLSLRTLVDESGEVRLAVGHEDGVRALTAPTRRLVRRESETCQLLLSRVGLDDVSMVILRR